MSERTVISVEPAADFGEGHGVLAITMGPGGTVVIDQADRVVYVPRDWAEKVASGSVPWAAHRRLRTFDWGVLTLTGHGRRVVVYEIIGACGPRVQAYLCRQPD